MYNYLASENNITLILFGGRSHPSSGSHCIPFRIMRPTPILWVKPLNSFATGVLYFWSSVFIAHDNSYPSKPFARQMNCKIFRIRQCFILCYYLFYLSSNAHYVMQIGYSFFRSMRSRSSKHSGLFVNVWLCAYVGACLCVTKRQIRCRVP